MLNSQKDEVSKIIKNFADLFRVLLSLFLIGIIMLWMAQIFQFDSYIPFSGNINAFLTKFNSHFVTQNVLEESDNSIVYLSVNIIILLVISSFISDVVKDMLQMYERSHEESVEEDNIRINEQIKKNYELHLKHNMQFIVALRLNVFKDSFQALAFSDPDYSQKLQVAVDKMLVEVKNLVTSSVKCDKTNVDDIIILHIQSPEQLNKILVFLKSLCQVEKYVKSGLEYFIAVTTHTVDEDPKEAMDSAVKLVNLGCKNKIVCYQIVPECLNTVLNNKFDATANGNYEDLPDSLYELVYKKE
ncbi:hypothetical protein J6S88_00685 [bacterium]|nr:hypothetical protein [bacterium]